MLEHLKCVVMCYAKTASAMMTFFFIYPGISVGIVRAGRDVQCAKLKAVMTKVL